MDTFDGDQFESHTCFDQQLEADKFICCLIMMNDEREND